MALAGIEKIAKGAVKIVIDRPKKKNALDIQLMKNLNQKLLEIEKDQKVHVIVLEGEGSCFCSGLDLNEATERDKIEESAEMLKTLLLRIYLSSKITIASVHGVAIAGGAGLLSVCDVAVAAKETKIGLPEVKRGLVPALILAFLRRKIPEGALREIVLTGRILTAEEAKSIGWIHHIVEESKRAEFVHQLVQEALTCAPVAVFHTKNLLESFHTRGIDEEVKLAEKVHRLSRESKEAMEGIKAFFEKRPAKWN
jgi:methylglutaconyl-CoA hydratase